MARPPFEQLFGKFDARREVRRIVGDVARLLRIVAQIEHDRRQPAAKVDVFVALGADDREVEAPGVDAEMRLHLAALDGAEVMLPVGSVAPVRRLLACERSEEHTSELQSREKLVCRLLLEKKKRNITNKYIIN